MLNQTGFDMWADEYDKSVALSDDSASYPFAGYERVLDEIYHGVLTHEAKHILDIGFGTATLTAKLYAQGCSVSGQDFSARMIELAQRKMPKAKLYQGDFRQGLVPQLRQDKYDAVVAAYSLHHLTDAQKVDFLKSLLPLLCDGGAIYIGDVAFETRSALEQCRMQVGEVWDADEIYFVYDELKVFFPHMTFRQISFCAGVLTIIK